MRKVNIQFHAMDTECAQLVKDFFEEFELKLLLVQEFPEFNIKEVDNCTDLLKELHSLGNNAYREFKLNLYEFNKDAKNSTELNRLNPNTLNLILGREKNMSLDESWLCSNYLVMY